MIPKVVHFFHDKEICPSGGSSQTSDLFSCCFATWQHYLPEYQFIHWHDQSPEFQQMLDSSSYLRECYQRKIWAVVADYVRAWVIFHYGGLYFDTDIYLMKNLDSLLDCQLFIPTVPHYQQENDTVWHVEPAFLGAQAGHPALKEILDIYNSNEIFERPFWIANQVFAIGLLRVNEGTLFAPLETENSLVVNANFLCQTLDHGQICDDVQLGIRLLPPAYFGQSGRVVKMGKRWVVTLPINQKDQKNPDAIFSFENMLAYHLCQNSWRKSQIYLETKHLAGAQKFFKTCSLTMRSWRESMMLVGLRKKIKAFLMRCVAKIWP